MTGYGGFCLLDWLWWFLFVPPPFFFFFQLKQTSSLVFVIHLLFDNSVFNPMRPDSYGLPLGIGKVMSGNLPTDTPDCFCFIRKQPKAAIIVTANAEGSETEIQGEGNS